MLSIALGIAVALVGLWIVAALLTGLDGVFSPSARKAQPDTQDQAHCVVCRWWYGWHRVKVM